MKETGILLLVFAFFITVASCTDETILQEITQVTVITNEIPYQRLALAINSPVGSHASLPAVSSVEVSAIAHSNVSITNILVDFIDADNNVRYTSNRRVSGFIVNTSLEVCLFPLESGQPRLRATAHANSGETATTTIQLEVGRYKAETIYVATNGNDSAIGYLKSAPVRSLQQGVDLAARYGASSVLVQAGTYSPGNGLAASTRGVYLTNGNLNLLGGYDASFSSASSRSILLGGNILQPIVANNVQGLFIDGFTVRDGKTTTGGGGGINVGGNGNTIGPNCLVMHCTVNGAGGGIAMSGNYNVCQATVVSNSAGSGGGIHFSGKHGIIEGQVWRNRATSYGGGIETGWGGTSSCHINADVWNNVAGKLGGGIMNWGDKNAIWGKVYGNTAYEVTAFGTGGGVFNVVGSGVSAYWKGIWLTGNTPDNWGGTAALP